MDIKLLYNDYLRKLPNEYGDVSVMRINTEIINRSSSIVISFQINIQLACFPA